MYSDGNNSEQASSDSEDKKAHKRSSGKSVERKKKHDKHKKHKKAKKHKKHRHQSEGESEDDVKSDGGSVSSGSRKRSQQQEQPSPELYTGKEARVKARSVARGREPPVEHARQERIDRMQSREGPSSRWDSPGEGEGGRRPHSQHQNYDHSKSQRFTRPDTEGRNDNNYRNGGRYQRENNRRRSPPATVRSRSPSAERVRGRGEQHRERPRYSGEESRQSHPVSDRHEESHRGGTRNGREQHRDTDRFDDGRRPYRRSDNYAADHSGSRRTQDHSGGGGEEGRQRRYSSPNQSNRRPQQQRERDRPSYPNDEREDRQQRGGDYRGEFRDQRTTNRAAHADQNRSWRGGPPPGEERERGRRDRNDERERERGREGTRDVSRPAEVKVERSRSSSPRGRNHSHKNDNNQPESSTGDARRDRERSATGRAPRKAPFRRERDENEDEQQFEWGGGRRDGANPNRSQGERQPHVPRSIKTEEAAVKKEEPTSDTESAPPPKQKPNFALSGKLTEETNKVNGTVITYAEPPGARKPKRRWRIYPFKGEQVLPTLYIHRQSCYLIGRDRKVCDLPVDHPSCSKQHAVLQYRLVPYQKADGSTSQRVRPYIIDLESANGTFVNNKKIEPKRYLELFEKDVLKFGFSSREYVLLHENSKEENEDDDGYEVSPTS